MATHKGMRDTQGNSQGPGKHTRVNDYRKQLPPLALREQKEGEDPAVAVL